jgi:hypothetical protein
MPIKNEKRKGDMIVVVDVSIPGYGADELLQLKKVFEEIEE